ncbi:cation:proton antiporter family protein [Halioglobus sp. HI00S01]|uniref:cation:proton antiporter family protein n=1 Tax=Halioglobus sp. HI00S01 TaxID=1822214 RepID=UPI000826074C|nr:cation:proton antiporter family protein [Halioglobus sp. HI00S01]
MILDPLIILIALGCGLVARITGLPALIGYLAAGFVLHETNIEAGSLLNHLADLGVTLLLFTIGLKLSPRDLLQAKVWGTTLIHMQLMQLFFMGVLWLYDSLVPSMNMSFTEILVIAFGLTFSSTVFVIQVMQEKGEMSSRHANLAIGILVIQDLAAVLFLSATKGMWPEPTALLLPALWLLRAPVLRLLSYAGHGELFTLAGMALALGGAALFEFVGIKGDLGALIIGALLSGSQKGKELSRNLMNLKDLFLVGFFLSIGLGGWPQQEALILAVLLGVLAIVKIPLYFPLMTKLHTGPRTALLAACAMGNFSEFGLVVVAVAAKAGWLDAQWASAISLAIAISFVISAPLNRYAHELYWKYHSFWRKFESDRLRRERPDTSGARIIVLGMGNIGTGAYDTLAETHGAEVLGVDLNEAKLAEHTRRHRRVVPADASDPDFWVQVDLTEVDLVLLALTNHPENVLVADLLRELDYQGRVAAVVRFREEAEELETHGISVFNLYAQAGAGFAEHAAAQLSNNA